MVTAEVGAMVFGPPLTTPGDVKRLGLTVHWGHGLAMGVLRGALGATPLAPVVASVLHFVLLWGGDVALYKALGIAPWPWRWGGTALATDLFHKFVLSAVTSVTFIALYSLVS